MHFQPWWLSTQPPGPFMNLIRPSQLRSQQTFDQHSTSSAASFMVALIFDSPHIEHFVTSTPASTFLGQQQHEDEGLQTVMRSLAAVAGCSAAGPPAAATAAAAACKWQRWAEVTAAASHAPLQQRSCAAARQLPARAPAQGPLLGVPAQWHLPPVQPAGRRMRLTSWSLQM